MLSQDLEHLETMLFDEVGEAMRLVERGPTPYNRRATVRAIFAYFEGMLYLMRQRCIENEGGTRQPTAAELALLKEEAYVIEEGEAKTVSRYSGFRKTFRFTVAMFARLLDLPFSADYGTVGWSNMCKAEEIRDGITHPKEGASWDITVKDVQTTLSALAWFQEQMGTLYGLASVEIKRRVGRIEEAKAQLEEMAKRPLPDIEKK